MQTETPPTLHARPHQAAVAATRRRCEAGGLGLLLLPLVIALAVLVYRSTLAAPINYNEGWNAYYTSLVLHGRPLYYPPTALLINNYPPLSFLLVAPVAALVGDALLAGRLVAWLAFAAVAVTIAAILWRLDRDRVAAIFGAAVFTSYMVVNYSIYVGMDDPQMLAHAFTLLGLYVYLRWSASTWASIAAAVLMCCGLFTKHNIIGLPVTLAIWLFIYDRKACWRFAGAGIVCAAVGLAACIRGFGPDFLADIRAPRPYIAVRAWRHIVEWTVPMQVPLITSAFACAPGLRDRHSILFTLYLMISLGVGYAAAGGDATNFNLLFDAVIGFALAAGHLLARLEATPVAGLRPLVIAALAFSISLTTALVGSKDAFLIRPWVDAQRRLEAVTRDEVRMVAARPGPALCTDLALCYWAGKNFELDPLNFTFGVIARTKNLEPVLQRVASGYYATIAIPLAPGPVPLLPPQLIAAIKSHYRLLESTPHDEIYARP